MNIGDFVRKEDYCLIEGQVKDIDGNTILVMDDTMSFFSMDWNDAESIERPDYWTEHLDEVKIV